MKFDVFDIWWRHRGEQNALSQMRVQLEKALSQKASPQIEYSISWRLARLHHFCAMQKEDDKKIAHELFSTAKTQAQHAVSLNANDVAGHFWLGVCCLETARTQSKMTALRALPRAKKHLKIAATLDETFHFAGARRVLGRIESRAPFPFGSQQNALVLFNRALEIAPHNSTTLLYFAELLLSMKRDEAQKTLHEIVSQDVDENWKWEQARDKTIAARLLEVNKWES